MSASDEIKLWCWVLGDTCERVFPVISSAHIEDLKKAIKGKIYRSKTSVLTP